MKTDNKKEIRFYVCLILAYVLLMISLFLPPVNVITSSVLYAAIALLGTGALAIGLDISGILRELRLLKQATLEELQAAERMDLKEEQNENEE